MQQEELEAILKQNVRNDLEEYFSRVQNFLVNHNRRSKRIIEEAIKRLKDKEFLERYFEIYDYTLYVDKLTDLVVSGVLNSADLVGIIGQMVFLDDYFKELKKKGDNIGMGRNDNGIPFRGSSFDARNRISFSNIGWWYSGPSGLRFS